MVLGCQTPSPLEDEDGSRRDSRREEESELRKGPGCLVLPLAGVTIVSCFLGYRWPSKGHWAVQDSDGAL